MEPGSSVWRRSPSLSCCVEGWAPKGSHPLVVFARVQGLIEYWSGTAPHKAPEPPVVSFTSKLDTDLFDLVKAKTTAQSITVRAATRRTREVQSSAELACVLHRCAVRGRVVHSQVSKDGAQFVAMCADKRIRVFRFETGKLRRVYDESIEVRARPLFTSARVHVRAARRRKSFA